MLKILEKILRALKKSPTLLKGKMLNSHLNSFQWLVFISGELPNSATYFSSFANVQISENVEMGHTFGGQDSHFMLELQRFFKSCETC